MSPHFGQGGGLALLDSVSLAGAIGSPTEVGSPDRIPAILAAWERGHRSVADTTQRYATFYARIQSNWPAPLLSLRSAMLEALSKWSARIMAAGMLHQA
jgi:2-polyprenyl-6-methoxyphenol hydroxylase-like FAD-dependent oxidoreductase